MNQTITSLRSFGAVFNRRALLASRGPYREKTPTFLVPHNRAAYTVNAMFPVKVITHHYFRKFKDRFHTHTSTQTFLKFPDRVGSTRQRMSYYLNTHGMLPRNLGWCSGKTPP